MSEKIFRVGAKRGCGGEGLWLQLFQSQYKRSAIGGFADPVGVM
jgi:hypothetical protein